VRGKLRVAYAFPCREYPEADCYTEGVGNTGNRLPRIIVVVALFVALTGMGARSFAANAQSGTAQVEASPLELVRSAVAHEVAAANDSSAKHMFRSRKQSLQGSQTRL
jgi:hypothetical protein